MIQGQKTFPELPAGPAQCALCGAARAPVPNSAPSQRPVGWTMKERQLQLGKAGSPGFAAQQHQENTALTNHIRIDPEPLFSSEQLLQGRTPQKLKKRRYSLSVGAAYLGRAANREGHRLRWPGAARGTLEPAQPSSPLPAPEPPPQLWGDQSR